MALEADLLDLLFVAVQAQGQGIGTLLVTKAKTLSPCKLRAYTFQRNKTARSFFGSRALLRLDSARVPRPRTSQMLSLDGRRAWIVNGPTPGDRCTSHENDPLGCAVAREPDMVIPEHRLV